MKPYSPSRTNPWNDRQINLVARRLGFGCSLSDINLYLNSTPGAMIDDIVGGAADLEVTPAPEWGQWDNTLRANLFWLNSGLVFFPYFFENLFNHPSQFQGILVAPQLAFFFP
ncbi:MAG: hypothetical protein ACO3MA_05110 [Flavobacteriaceae bacterium]